jgi:hypothetical protein
LITVVDGSLLKDDKNICGKASLNAIVTRTMRARMCTKNEILNNKKIKLFLVANLVALLMSRIVDS